MKIIIIKAFVLCIRILYAFMKLRKTQNKIVWLSRQSDSKSFDMLLLEDALKKESPSTKQVFRLKKLKDESSLSLSYIFSIFGDMWEMASAKVVITDTYSIPVSCLKHKKELEIIQLWHALGAVKKFSLQAAGKAQGRDMSVSQAMHMHENYTYVIAPSRITGRFYCEAFGCKEECIKIFSLPRVDDLMDGKNRREEFLELNPEYKGKKLVAYIPTFRTDDDVYAQMLYDAFKTCEDYKLIISAHPLSKTAETDNYKFNGSFSSKDFIKMSDIIISDYSACSFEAALFEKPLYFYIPDYDIYTDEQGLNVDMKKEMPHASFEDARELVKSIESGEYDIKTVVDFGNKYVENKGTDNSQKIAEFITSLINKKV